MTNQEEYERLEYILSAIDTHKEFNEEWKEDIEKIRMFIKLHMGNFLPNDSDTFGTYLTRLRDFKGLTNKILSERTGMTESAISKYLHDKGRTKAYTLALMIAFQLETEQVDAVFSLAELRIDRKTNYNDIVNYYLKNSGENAVKECNRTLLMFGFDALTFQDEAPYI